MKPRILALAGSTRTDSFNKKLVRVAAGGARPAEGEPMLACFDGKVAALMSTSPGGLGGLRGLAAVRSILGGIRVLVLPQQVAVPQAHAAFDGEGNLTDEKCRAAVEALGAAVAETVAKLSG